MPGGFWGENTLADLMKAQGFTGPQRPSERPGEIDDEAADELLRSIEEIRCYR